MSIIFDGSPRADEPANLSDLKAEIEGWVATGGYRADLYATLQPLYPWLERRMAEAAPGERLAVVIDIDDTALSNYEAAHANGFGFFPEGPCDALPHGPCGWTGWVALEKATAIEPMLALYRHAVDLGYAAVFLSGRREAWRAATEDNLREEGFDTWKAVLLKPDDLHVPSAADYKAPVRAGLEAEGWTIVLNVGDQQSDLAGGHAERVVLLANPFYRIP